MYAYCTLLTNINYYFAVLSLKLSLDQQNTKYPLIILYTDTIPELCIEHLTALGCICIYQENKYNAYFVLEEYFLKFETFQLINYKKIFFLDADIIIKKNLDYLFELDVNYLYFNLEYNIDNKSLFINAFLFIITPDIKIYNQLYNFTIDYYLTHQKEINDKKVFITEEDVLTKFYRSNNLLPYDFLNKYIQIASPHDNLIFCNDDVALYHFVGKYKVWEIFTNTYNNFYLSYIIDNINFFKIHYLNILNKIKNINIESYDYLAHNKDRL